MDERHQQEVNLLMPFYHPVFTGDVMAFFELLPSHMVANPIGSNMLENLIERRILERPDAYYVFRDAIDILHEINMDIGKGENATISHVEELLARARSASPAVLANAA